MIEEKDEMKDLESLFTAGMVCFLFGAIFGVAVSFSSGKDKVVNDLCSKQKYDFCVVDRYKLGGMEK